MSIGQQPRETLISFTPDQICLNLQLSTVFFIRSHVIFSCLIKSTQCLSVVTKSCFYHIRYLRRIREILNQEFLILFTNCFARSRTAHCNSLKKDLNQLWCVENNMCVTSSSSTNYTSYQSISTLYIFTDLQNYNILSTTRTPPRQFPLGVP